MKKQKFVVFLLLSVFILVSISFVHAGESGVLGEIRTSGVVLIKSTSDKWMRSGTTYPLINDTTIRTRKGLASIYLKDLIRVDLSQNTTAVVNAGREGYGITLTNGTMAFNVSPSASLSVKTTSTSIFIETVNEGLEQKVSNENPQNILGVISAGDTGTEIKSISGSISVAVSGSGTKSIDAGESIMVAADNTYKVSMMGKDATERESNLGATWECKEKRRRQSPHSF